MPDERITIVVEGKDTLSPVTEKANRSLGNLGKAADGAHARLTALSSRLSTMGNLLTVGVTLPLVGLGTAMTKMAADVVESENLFAVTMGDMADEARRWSEELREQLGLNA